MISMNRMAEVFVGVADTLVGEFDLIDFLHSLTLHATEVTGSPAVGLLLSDVSGRSQPRGRVQRGREDPGAVPAPAR